MVLPVYNGGPFFAESIESILNQSFHNFELLILDDASEDDSPETALQMARGDSRIRVITAKQNLGLSAQLNIGIEESSGPFIARMDADDIAVPNRLQLQIDYLHQNPDVGICGGLAQEFTGETRGLQWELPELHDSIRSFQFFQCGFNHPSVMIRRSVLLENSLSYREDFRIAQDYELWVRLLEVTRGHNLQQVLINYRRSDSQISQLHCMRKNKEVAQIRKTIRSRLGMESTEINASFHDYVAADCWPQDPQTVSSLCEWVDSVAAMNRTRQVFTPEVFDTLLRERLRRQCYMATSDRLNGLQLLRRSSLHSSSPLSGLQVARFFAKRYRSVIHSALNGATDD